MRYSSFKICFAIAITCFSFWPARAQSRDQNFPTPVASNEISGVIKARDIGDSRLTTYFYTFDGNQGDIFVNIVTKNLTGDIDVFTADSLQPLTKVVLYADSAQNETGRLIYLRRPARLILRVEGRSPNDDAATFRIRFAGSFVALASKEADVGPVVEHSDKNDSSGIRVNSVGTIIEIPPKPTKDEAKPLETQKSEKKEETESETAVKPSADGAPARSKPAPDVKTVFGSRPPATAVVMDEPPSKPDAKTTPTRRNRSRSTPPASKEKAPDPLASINLVILMKDGDVIERPMNEVARFSVDKGVLTVVTKDGKTSRFSILDVEKVTIQ